MMFFLIRRYFVETAPELGETGLGAKFWWGKFSAPLSCIFSGHSHVANVNDIACKR